MNKKVFICYWYFVGWDCIQFGLHICFSAFNIEVHLPFGFFRIGFISESKEEYFLISRKQLLKVGMNIKKDGTFSYKRIYGK